MAKNNANKVGVDSFIKRFKSAKAHRATWEDHWQECYEYALPQREVFSNRQPGSKKNTRIYDSTALIATQRFASRLQSTLIPPFKQWAKLSAGSSIPKEQQTQVEGELEQMTKTLFGYLNQSNLATEANEAFLDLAIGTGALLLEEGEGDQLLKFTAVPLKQLIVENGPQGTVETVYREHGVPARDILRIWPKGTVSSQVQRLIDEKPNDLIAVIEGTIYNDKNKNYDYVIVEEKTNHVIFEDTYKNTPWIVFRWSKVAGERYGRGPVMTALPDIKTANEVVKFVLNNAEKEIAGVYTAVDDGVLNPWTVNTAPGSIIPVAQQGSLSQLQSGGNFNVSQLVLEELRNNIRMALYHDQLGPVGGPTKSATEISLRQQELMSDIGSSFGRLQKEFINKVIKRSIDILQGNGLVPDIAVGNQVIDIKVISPLAQQQDMDEVNKIAQFIEFSGMVGEEALTIGLDLEAIPEHIGKLLGIDPALIRSKNQREELKKARAEQQKSMQMAEMAANNPDLAKEAAENPEIADAAMKGQL